MEAASRGANASDQMLPYDRTPFWIVLLALTFPFILAGVTIVIIEIFPPSAEEIRCSQAEWAVQEAGKCLARPEMWERWAQIDRIYGVKEQSCQEMIAELGEFGFSRNEARTAGHWMDAYESNVQSYWLNVVGMPFCSDVASRKSRKMSIVP